jgi:hypothetical protein
MSEFSMEAVHARMKQARETLQEAEMLFEQDLWRGTITAHIMPCSIADTALKEARLFIKTIEDYLEEQ